MGDIISLVGELPEKGQRFKATKEGNQFEMELSLGVNDSEFNMKDTLTITDVILIGTSGITQRMLQDEDTGNIYLVNDVFIRIVNNEMIDEEHGEYAVFKPYFHPWKGILWKNNVCKLRANFRSDDKNGKVLNSLKGVDITPEIPE